jgi:GNAT superfamily N-acetyltransferase
MLNSLIIRQMNYGDISCAMRLKTAAGWNQTEQDWERFLDINPGGCFAALLNGTVVGTVTAINYENRISWIGMMLVDPEYRRKGIATCLMKHALEHLKGCGTIKLDATPEGKKVYDRLGFKVEYVLFRMTACIPNYHEILSKDITPVTVDDFPALTHMDRAVFGAGRIEILKSLVRNNPEIAFRCLRDGSLSGYCMGRPGTGFYQIGPIIAQKAEDAIALTQAAMMKLDGCAVLIDVPAHHHEFVDWLVSAGFTIERQFIRMFYGGNEFPGQPEYVFGISGPEQG